MTNQKGFTLIEIVVVIVILGILAVTAAPKFMNIQDEAKTSSLQALGGAIHNAIGMTRVKAILENKEAQAEETVMMMGSEVNITYGSPRGPEDLEAVLNNLDQWTLSPEGIEAEYGGIVYGLNNFECAVEYIVATSNKVADVKMIGDDCKPVGGSNGNQGSEAI